MQELVQTEDNDKEEFTSLQDAQSEMREHYREGRITILEGKQRTGKTLGMSILADNERRIQKREILSNIVYKFPFRPLNFFELTMEEIGVYQNKCITIDELNFYLDSRATVTKINRRFCQWLLQSKKMGIDTYGTTHNLFYLDIRFRENFDYLIRTSVFPVKRPEGIPPQILRMEWYNGPNQRPFHKVMKIDLVKNKHLLGMYNNHQLLNPFSEMEDRMALDKASQKVKESNLMKMLKTKGGTPSGN